MDLFVFVKNSLEGYMPRLWTIFYDMYIVLCEYWFPCYFIVQINSQKGWKAQDEKILWTLRCNIYI